jgi:hypothetical protein
LILGVADFDSMTVKTASYDAKISKHAANAHKNKPPNDSAKCVAGEIAKTASHINQYSLIDFITVCHASRLAGVTSFRSHQST